MQKGFTPIYLLLGVLIFAALSGAYYFGKTVQKPITTPQSAPVQSLAPVSTSESTDSVVNSPLTSKDSQVKIVTPIPASCKSTEIPPLYPKFQWTSQTQEEFGVHTSINSLDQSVVNGYRNEIILSLSDKDATNSNIAIDFINYYNQYLETHKWEKMVEGQGGGYAFEYKKGDCYIQFGGGGLPISEKMTPNGPIYTQARFWVQHN